MSGSEITHAQIEKVRIGHNEMIQEHGVEAARVEHLHREPLETASINSQPDVLASAPESATIQ
jgi:hypothetical protein